MCTCVFGACVKLYVRSCGDCITLLKLCKCEFVRLSTYVYGCACVRFVSVCVCVLYESVCACVLRTTRIYMCVGVSE